MLHLVPIDATKLPTTPGRVLFIIINTIQPIQLLDPEASQRGVVRIVGTTISVA